MNHLLYEGKAKEVKEMTEVSASPAASSASNRIKRNLVRREQAV